MSSASLRGAVGVGPRSLSVAENVAPPKLRRRASTGKEKPLQKFSTISEPPSFLSRTILTADGNRRRRGGAEGGGTEGGEGAEERASTESADESRLGGVVGRGVGGGAGAAGSRRSGSNVSPLRETDARPLDRRVTFLPRILGPLTPRRSRDVGAGRTNPTCASLGRQKGVRERWRRTEGVGLTPRSLVFYFSVSPEVIGFLFCLFLFFRLYFLFLLLSQE